MGGIVDRMGRAYQLLSLSQLTAISAAVLFFAQIPSKAGDISSNWTNILGADQHWVGLSGDELSFERYQKLIDSNAAFSVGVSKKWQILTNLIRDQKPYVQLNLTQQFINTLPYHSDEELYMRNDYWAFAGEFLRNGGDCEDFAIAKYRLLIDAGFDPQRLRVALVTNKETQEPHAILAARLNGKTYILDNQRQGLSVEKDLSHYQVIYSLNQIGVWRHQRPQTPDQLETMAVATQSK